TKRTKYTKSTKDIFVSFASFVPFVSFVFSCLWGLPTLEHHHRLHMRRIREEIERVRASDGVAVVCVHDAARVPREGGDVARDVDQPRRVEPQDAIERLLRQAGPRRIDDDGGRMRLRRRPETSEKILHRLVHGD